MLQVRGSILDKMQKLFNQGMTDEANIESGWLLRGGDPLERGGMLLNKALLLLGCVSLESNLRLLGKMETNNSTISLGSCKE